MSFDPKELRARMGELSAQMRALVESTPPKQWGPTHAKKFDEMEREHKAIGNSLDNYQRLLDNIADERGASDFGGHSYASSPAEFKASLGSYCRTGDVSRFSPQDALTESGDGEIIVPSQLANEILAVAKKFSPLRSICRIISGNTAATKFTLPVITDGAASGWASETDARPETVAPKIASVAFPDAEVYCNVMLSQWITEDTRAGEMVVSEIGKAFGRAEGRAFLLGNGVNQPIGFLNGTPSSADDDTRAFGTLQFLNSGSASTITADALIELMFALKPEYRANGCWVMNSNVISIVRRLKNTNGDYLWSDSLAEGQPPRLLGYRVLECNDMPDIEADAFPIAFGDFLSGYAILDRQTMLLRDPYSNKPMVSIYGRKRVSGAVTDSCAIKLLKIAA